MPGVLELAQDCFDSSVRIAIPDYIGVREPQFTAGVGILQFAYRNAKIQGKELYAAVRAEHSEPRPQTKEITKDEPKKKEKKENGKVSSIFKWFFD